MRAQRRGAGAGQKGAGGGGGRCPTSVETRRVCRGLAQRVVPAVLVVVMLAIVSVDRAAARRVADLDIPRDAHADDPTLQKAVDAYRQARTLDSQLKRSERAVERQTRQLRKGKKRSRARCSVMLQICNIKRCSDSLSPRQS